MFHFHKIKIRETSAVFCHSLPFQQYVHIFGGSIPAASSISSRRLYPSEVNPIRLQIFPPSCDSGRSRDPHNHQERSGPLFSFLFRNNTTGNQFHFRIGTRKIQILAAEQNRRTRCTGMNLLCAAFKRNSAVSRSCVPLTMESSTRTIRFPLISS